MAEKSRVNEVAVSDVVGVDDVDELVVGLWLAAELELDELELPQAARAMVAITIDAIADVLRTLCN
jgi:hypothetical protein